ncbi:helix-turn-helix domain-containing protein [Cetobacterium sp.]|uniref:helix-turn-helix domain-containing protein n=1 Tax=Cetobacterium sp. TaxID=2071632 RepID=UPI003AA1B341
MFSLLLRTYSNNNIRLVDFAKKLGISRQALNNSLKRWENKYPTIKTIKKISNSLEIDSSYFLKKC